MKVKSATLLKVLKKQFPQTIKKFLLSFIMLLFIQGCTIKENSLVESSSIDSAFYVASFNENRQEYFIGSSIYIIITPLNRDNRYQITECKLEIQDKNNWKYTEDLILPKEMLDFGFGSRGLFFSEIPIQEMYGSAFRLKITIQDELGNHIVLTDPLSISAEKPIAEKMENDEFLKLYPYSLYNQNSRFIQEKDLETEDALVLVQNNACKVINKYDLISNNKNVTCSILDNDACPITDYRLFLPDDDSQLKAEKFLGQYKNGSLFESEFISGKEFKLFLDDLISDRHLISIPLCFTKRDYEITESFMEYGMIFYDETENKAYVLSQSIYNEGIDFTIFALDNQKLFAHEFICTDETLEH